jgi:hypothetical protein
MIMVPSASQSVNRYKFALSRTSSESSENKSDICAIYRNLCHRSGGNLKEKITRSKYDRWQQRPLHKLAITGTRTSSVNNISCGEFQDHHHNLICFFLAPHKMSYFASLVDGSSAELENMKKNLILHKITQNHASLYESSSEMYELLSRCTRDRTQVFKNL